MAAYSFPALMKDLGEKFSIPNLEPTHNNNVALTLKGSNHLVVLQAHKSESFFIISFEITQLQPSRYQENIFKEALKFNGLNKSHQGIFGYNKLNQKFYLFDYISLNDTNPDQVHSIILSLAEKVTLWKEAITRGDIPVIEARQTQSSGGIFGIRP